MFGIKWSSNEKLPQAFLKIGRMENYFRNLKVKGWANFDNPINSYDFSMFCIISYMGLSMKLH